MNLKCKLGVWLFGAAASLCASAVMAAACSGVSVANATTDDVKLGGVDSGQCVVSAVNPHQFDGNPSGFSGVFPAGSSWSVIAGFDVDGNVDIGPNPLGGVNFTVGFTKTTGTTGTWSITATNLSVLSMDLVFAMHGSNRSGSFLFEDVALPVNTASNGTWAIQWVNAGGNVPNYSNLVVFGRDVRTSRTIPVPEPETYAMMLAGLGLLGLALRRRKQKASA